MDEDDLAWEDEMQRHFSRKDKEKEFDETVPRRWRKGPAPVRLEEMEEEEYAEAIRGKFCSESSRKFCPLSRICLIAASLTSDLIFSPT